MLAKYYKSPTDTEEYILLIPSNVEEKRFLDKIPLKRFLKISLEMAEEIGII